MNMKSSMAGAVLLLFSPLAMAVESLSASQLNEYCEAFAESPEAVLAQKCAAYVGGFLDGAVATDERVAVNVAAEIEDGESFSERAIRTRVYGRLRDFGPSVYAEFCVGDPVPIADVVGHVIEELNARESLDNIAARSIVYASVKKHYPCDDK